MWVWPLSSSLLSLLCRLPSGVCHSPFTVPYSLYKLNHVNHGFLKITSSSLSGTFQSLSCCFSLFFSPHDVMFWYCLTIVSLLTYLFCGYACLPECVSVHHLHEVPTMARRGQHIPWDPSCGCLWTSLWVLGIESRVSGRAAFSPSLQPHLIIADWMHILCINHPRECRLFLCGYVCFVFSQGLFLLLLTIMLLETSGTTLT